MALIAQETTRPQAATQPASSARSSAPDVVVVGAGFAGPLHAPPAARPRLLDAWCSRRRRRRRHLVLEPLPGRPLRHREHRLLVQLRSRARAGVEVVREVRHPAGDPALRSSSSPTSYDLRRDIHFSTRVESAHVGRRRRALADRAPTDGDELRCRFYVMATGCLSMPKTPDIAGVDRFGGESTSPSRWPHEGVDFTGKRVGVIGTGSSGIQSIPIIAEQAAQLTVFQRTPNFSRARRQRPGRPRASRRALDADRAAYREAAQWSRAGVPVEPTHGPALQVAARSARGATRRRGTRATCSRSLGVFADIAVEPGGQRRRSASSSATRSARSSTIPRPRRRCARRTTPFGTKRPCLDTDYFETFNLPHVRLVDLRSDPIADDHGDRHRHRATSPSSSTPSCSPPASTR